MEIRTLAGLTGESSGVALLVKLAVVIPSWSCRLRPGGWTQATNDGG